MRSQFHPSRLWIGEAGKIPWIKLGLYLLGASLAVAAQALSPATVDPLLALSLVAIAVAIWHGAFDGALAQEVLASRLGRWWLPIFGGGYLLLVGLVALLWWMAPALALCAFLLYSAWHFGTEMLDHITPFTALCGVAAGTLPIAAACAWHGSVTTSIFRTMLRGGADHHMAAHLSALSGFLLWPSAALVLVLGLVSLVRRRAGAVSSLGYLAVTLVLFRVCSPLVAFAVFFCTWHTPEHLLATSEDARGRFSAGRLWRHLRAGLLPWLLTLAALGGLCLWAPRQLLAYTALLFILLSALTVPHMLLGEVLRGRGPGGAWWPGQESNLRPSP